MTKFLSLLLISLIFLSCSTDTDVKKTTSGDYKKSEKRSEKKTDASRNSLSENAVPDSDKDQSHPVASTPEEISSSKSAQTALESAIAAGNYEQVKTESSNLLLINPKDIKALNSLAMYYYKRQNYEAALLLLNRALAADSNSSATYNNLGLIEIAKNNKREALNMFSKAILVDSKNFAAAANAAAIYVKEKDYNKAVFSLDNAVNNGKFVESSFNNYAIALGAIGEVEKAAAVYEKILKNNSGHREAMLNYAILMIEKQQKYKEGLDLINRLKFVGTENESRQVIKSLETKAKAGLK